LQPNGNGFSAHSSKIESSRCPKFFSKEFFGLKKSFESEANQSESYRKLVFWYMKQFVVGF
jgi:hypothetical protein